MTLSTSGTRTPSPPHHGGRGSAVPAGASAPRMDPVASCKESTNPWPTRATASGARRAKAVELTGACHTATRSSSGLGAGDEEENGGDDGRTRTSFRAQEYPLNPACSPKRRRTPIMTPAVAAALDRTRISDRTAVPLFTAVHCADGPLPLAHRAAPPEERAGEDG
ncbi:hypothetical protein GWK47_003277 [Chionoecetes opilio]|uniref:Uncharacterized protein n=1 Tax=Chionoecetes opilio TaxID=41210 RepID=A0A8J5D2H3_CHIOP|nr:hypothetical protein GWK47_003277 [Chionoecetes opilio]